MGAELILKAIEAMDWAAAKEAMDRAGLESGARGPQGQSLIQESVYRGGMEFAQTLARRLDNLDIFECTVLFREEGLESLLEANPGLARESSYDGWTALHLAGFVGAAACAGTLLSRGAEIDQLSSNAMANTPLSATLAGSGSLEIVNLLLKSGADPNKGGAGGFTPLHLAASRGAMEAIAALQKAGAKAVAAENGQTPADIASDRGFEEAAEAVS